MCMCMESNKQNILDSGFLGFILESDNQNLRQAEMFK